MALILLMSQLSRAADSEGRYIILGQGGVSCGTVVDEYDKDGLGRLTHSAWIQGYLTAINEEIYPGKNVTGSTDPDARMRWIYNYCKKNPLDILHKATNALLQELKLRSR